MEDGVYDCSLYDWPDVDDEDDLSEGYIAFQRGRETSVAQATLSRGITQREQVMLSWMISMV